MASIIFILNPQNFSITNVAQEGTSNSIPVVRPLPQLPEFKLQTQPGGGLRKRLSVCEHDK